jgi:hypothetical protein
VTFIGRLLLPQPSFFECGISGDQEGDKKEKDDAWPEQPLASITCNGRVKVPLRKIAQHISEGKRRTGPSESHHQYSDPSEDEKHNDIPEVAVCGKGTDKT